MNIANLGTQAKNETSSISSYTPSTGPLHLTPIVKQDAKLVNAAPRIAEQARRNPSPLSRPDNMNLDAQKQQIPQVLPPSSSAADHLTAVSKKDEKKSKSKLRRAFSFGSASELRRASAQNNLEKNAAETSKADKRNSKYEDEMEPAEAKVARDQEAGGLGESIYSGQGRFFTGSTDNLSVSSTASSASLMLRKMGKGVKKSTRSLVGLFRPKSVVGVPAADGPVNEASVAQVTMVTVEAERAKVNVNLDPHDQPGGGTGFPKLERNSIDAKRSTDSATLSSDTRSRRSIVGGERERAEVLAAVKKGILKRNDSSQSQSSPKLRSYDFKTPDFNLPMIPNMTDTPHSSAPSTPRDENIPRSDQRPADSFTVEGTDNDDYFNSTTYAATIDPKGSLLSRNISFSPRIQFHDTWPGSEYDRRGEIATCNRLTPMLAQQIKEELNTFKMVCLTPPRVYLSC